jgi:hypothetical protein
MKQTYKMVLTTHEDEKGIWWNEIKTEAKKIRKSSELLVNFYTQSPFYAFLL